MHDIKLIRKQLDDFKAAMKTRGQTVDFDALLQMDDRRRSIITEVEGLKSEKNKQSKEIGKVKSQGGDITDILAQVSNASDKIKALDTEQHEVDQALRQALLMIPNLPHESVPVGADESDNVEVCRRGDIVTFDFDPKSHDELGVDLDILDFERGAKLSGARFVLLKGAGARLERALINFMLDIQTGEHGYTEPQASPADNSP